MSASKIKPTDILAYGELKAVKRDKDGDWFHEQEAHRFILCESRVDVLFKNRGKQMRSDLTQASTEIEAMTKVLADRINGLVKAEGALTEQTKQVSGKVRDATEKLSVSLSKIEKLANFDRLERMVDLLERAAGAIATLAEMDKQGRLEKIAGILR